MQMMGSISEFENALRKERSIRGKIEKRRQGKIDKVKKYGFIYNNKKKNGEIFIRNRINTIKYQIVTNF